VYKPHSTLDQKFQIEHYLLTLLYMHWKSRIKIP